MAAPESPGTQGVGRQSYVTSILSLGYGARWKVCQESRKEAIVNVPASLLQWPVPQSTELLTLRIGTTSHCVQDDVTHIGR